MGNLKNLNDENDITIRTIKEEKELPYSDQQKIDFSYRSYRCIVLIVGMLEAKRSYFYPISPKFESRSVYR